MIEQPWAWVAIFTVAALALFVVEILVPSGGLIGSLSLVSLLGANVALFFISITAGVIGLIASAVLVPAAVALGVKVFPHTFIGRRLILADRQPADENVHYSSDTSDNYTGLVGKRGVVVTEMHPVGTVKFDDRRIECLSDRGIIERGTSVEVVTVQGIEVKVRPVE